MKPEIDLVINGKNETAESGTNVLKLLKKKNIRPEVAVIELNGKIIDKKDYGTAVLKSGDAVEIVFFMGGGAAAGVGERGRR